MPPKKKKQELSFNDPILNVTYSVDSVEEIAIYNWCIEAVKEGLIESWTVDSPIYQPFSITVFDSVSKTEESNPVVLLKGIKMPKSKSTTLLREHAYTPDFKLTFTDKFIQLFPEALPKLLKPTTVDVNNNSAVVYIDVKGAFNLHSGDRVFSINQKWVYQQTKIFVNKLVPDDLFHLTYVPTAEQYTKKKKTLREKYITCKTLEECINNKV